MAGRLLEDGGGGQFRNCMGGRLGWGGMHHLMQHQYNLAVETEFYPMVARLILKIHLIFYSPYFIVPYIKFPTPKFFTPFRNP